MIVGIPDGDRAYNAAQVSRQVKGKNLLLRTWLPALLWTLIIASESLFGSAANTGMVLQHMLKWLLGDFEPAHFAVLHHVLRKGGHFLGYGIFGYLWFRAFMSTVRQPLMSAALAIAFTVLVAALDEWHQSFSSDRSGEFSDVVLDTSGAVILVSIALLCMPRRGKTRPKLA